MNTIQKGDYGYALNFTIQDNSGTPLDLTNGSVWFKMGLVNTGSSSFSGACTITTAISGTCSYTLVSGTTNTAGVYDGEHEVIYTTSRITSPVNQPIIIKANLDNS